jgi:xanthine dehydrogenase iron-sulfur cluster and FAD-binding subunit A
MDIPSLKLHAWKDAEAELAHIERAFKALSADLTPLDRERVTQQLAALKAARLRVRLLFEEVMRESALLVERLAESEPSAMPLGRNRDRPSSEDWLS